MLVSTILLSFGAVNASPPSTPAAPTGPTNGKSGGLYFFEIAPVIAEGDHQVFFFVDWNDSLNTGWIGPYNSGTNVNLVVEVAHTWTTEGIYHIRVKAKDAVTMEETPWSVAHNITISGNTGPMFSVASVRGGFGVTVTIENKLAPSKYVDYTIDIAGGQITGFHVHQYTNGTVFIISGETATIKVPVFFTLGRTTISVTAKCAGEKVASATYESFVLFFYVMNVKEVV